MTTFFIKSLIPGVKDCSWSSKNNRNQELVFLVDSSFVRNTLQFIKYNSFFQVKVLSDISGIDLLKTKNRSPIFSNVSNRFCVVYVLRSLLFNMNFRLIVPVDSDTIEVPSVVDIFSSAGWFECEVFEFFGIRFSGNANLHRLLTDYGFEGNPLCKDFPLSGYSEVSYSYSNKRVIHTPTVELSQVKGFKDS